MVAVFKSLSGVINQLSSKKSLPKPKDNTKEQKFKPVPKKVLPNPEVIHFGNATSGPLCGASYQGAKVALQTYNCGACLDAWEEVMFDKLYGTNMEEDNTTP